MEEARMGNPSWRDGVRCWEETGNGLRWLLVSSSSELDRPAIDRIQAVSYVRAEH